MIDKDAIILELAQAYGPRKPPDGSFTAKDYVESLKGTEYEIVSDSGLEHGDIKLARSWLNAMVANGVLEKERFGTTLYFWQKGNADV